MPKQKALKDRILEHKYLYLMILPGITFYIIFHYAPLYGIQLAFKKFMYNQGVWGSPWTGVYNFTRLWGDTQFWGTVKNTFIISFGKLLFGFPAPIILALSLNELKNKKYKKVIQSVLYLPHFLSWVIVSGIVFNLLSSTNGSITKILAEYFGIEQVRILGNPKFFRPLVYATHVWKTAGWGTIVYLAAISGIDTTIYESAIIDGANRFEQAIYITIPSLQFAIFILLILNVGRAMDAGFMQVFNLYDASVYSVGDIIDTYVYRTGVVGARYEFSTAVGLFKSVINCLLLLISNWIVKKIGGQGIY